MAANLFAYWGWEAAEQGLSLYERALFVRAMIAEEMLNGGPNVRPWPDEEEDLDARSD